MNDALLLQWCLCDYLQDTSRSTITLASLSGHFWLITPQISRGGLEKHGRNVLPSAMIKAEERTFLRYLVVVPTPNVPFLIALAVRWFKTT